MDENYKRLDEKYFLHRKKFYKVKNYIELY